MSQLKWTEELVPPPPGYYDASRVYTLKGNAITATLTQVYAIGATLTQVNEYWVLWCGPLEVDKDFLGEPERSIDEVLQDAKAYLLATAEKKLRDLQAFVDQISDSESPQ